MKRVTEMGRNYIRNSDIDDYSSLKGLVRGIHDNEDRLRYMKAIFESDYHIDIPNKESMAITFGGSRLIARVKDMQGTFCNGAVIVMSGKHYFDHASAPSTKDPLKRFMSVYDWHGISLETTYDLYKGVGGKVPAISPYINVTDDHALFVLSYIDLKERKGRDLTYKVIDETQKRLMEEFMTEVSILSSHR